MEKVKSDNLAKMPDHEIESLYRKVTGNIRALRKKAKRYNDEYSLETALSLEIEACYIWRELETRKMRKAAHESFLRDMKGDRARFENIS
tara:strand:- start:87 stop:356 length:270 start_codon:yes stop_codon:yes gene_type:complete